MSALESWAAGIGLYWIMVLLIVVIKAAEEGTPILRSPLEMLAYVVNWPINLAIALRENYWSGVSQLVSFIGFQVAIVTLFGFSWTLLVLLAAIPLLWLVGDVLLFWAADARTDRIVNG